ncbi:sulfotransferase [Glycomyces sp. NPDC021274]|uniref:sulfotransferase family protein n=1 Tax=Glycomyces sp. NPDC021274 TaxID=3155120 RepID=UPI00340682D8
MTSRITVTARLLNLALTPASGGRKRPEAAWRQTVAAAEKAHGRPLNDAERQFADEQGFALASLAHAADDLTPLGWQAVHSDVKGRLENHLRMNRITADHPAVLDEEIRRPVFVIGLPRTATTLAHKILALSADHRGPLMWEMLHTDIETDPAVIDRRVRALAKQIGAVAKISPLWEVIHPIRVDQPEESLFLLPHGYFHPLLRGPMPRYQRWLESRDTTQDYEQLKLALQVLQFDRAPKRWILKYPLHLNDMETIVKVFPDATFVWTHRDPTTAMGSMCSLLETSWSMARKRPDLGAIGKLSLELMVKAIDRARTARSALPPESVVDVPYHLLNSDPHRNVPKIYEAIGAEWTDRDAANLDSALARPVTDRRHEYGLTRYGLDLDGVEAAFGDYTRLVAGFNR